MSPGNGKITPWAALLLACAWSPVTWALANCGATARAEEAPGFFSPEATATATAPELPRVDVARAPQPGAGPAFNVVRFAAGTVEFAVPQDWTVKQVPLVREVRIVAGPGDAPDDPSRLESGFWLAYDRASPVLAAGAAFAAMRPPIDDELRTRLPKAAGSDARLVGPPEAIKVGGFAGLKQRLELAGADAGLIRRASYFVVQTPWGVLELMAVAPLFAEGNASARLAGIVTSLAFFAPQPLPAVSSPDINDARVALGSWKGQKGSLHLLPNGRVRMEFDTVLTLAAPQGKAAPRQSVESVEGRFTARSDLIFITWDGGGKLNYRWRLDHDELQLLDHDRKFSRLHRLFESPITEAAAGERKRFRTRTLAWAERSQPLRQSSGCRVKWRYDVSNKAGSRCA